MMLTKNQVKERIHEIMDAHMDGTYLTPSEQDFMLKEVYAYWPSKDGKTTEQIIAEGGGIEYMMPTRNTVHANGRWISTIGVGVKLRNNDELVVWGFTVCLKNRPNSRLK